MADKTQQQTIQNPTQDQLRQASYALKAHGGVYGAQLARDLDRQLAETGETVERVGGGADSSLTSTDEDGQESQQGA